MLNDLTVARFWLHTTHGTSKSVHAKHINYLLLRHYHQRSVFDRCPTYKPTPAIHLAGVDTDTDETQCQGHAEER